MTSSIATTATSLGRLGRRAPGSASRPCLVRDAGQRSASCAYGDEPRARPRRGRPRPGPRSGRRRAGGAAVATAPCPGEVGVAGADDDGPLAPRVADRDGALRHGRPGAGAGVGRDPPRAADGRDAVAPVRAEAPALVRAPELAALRRHGSGAGAALPGAAPERGAAEVDVGDAPAGRGLADAEDRRRGTAPSASCRRAARSLARPRPPACRRRHPTAPLRRRRGRRSRPRRAPSPSRSRPREQRGRSCRARASQVPVRPARAPGRRRPARRRAAAGRAPAPS